ncbi:MAG: phosphoserine phosphatase SerB [Methanosarcinales archaeon]|nr:phosphoserine phosphatase SerB [Methanosarcinales archaeon]
MNTDIPDIGCATKEKKYAKLIVFDMDSTLIDAETIDELARAAGVVEKVSDITNRAMCGELDYGKALAERAALLKGLSLDAATQASDAMPWMEGAHELVGHAKKLGYKTAMISGGFTISADRVGRELGMDHIMSNELEVVDGVLTGNVGGPLTMQDGKANAFVEIAKNEGVLPEDCIVIGDGANDICLFKKAGFGIAFNAKPILKEHADASIDGKDLQKIIPLIDAITQLSDCCN